MDPGRGRGGPGVAGGGRVAPMKVDGRRAAGPIVVSLRQASAPHHRKQVSSSHCIARVRVSEPTPSPSRPPPQTRPRSRSKTGSSSRRWRRRLLGNPPRPSPTGPSSPWTRSTAARRSALRSATTRWSCRWRGCSGFAMPGHALECGSPEAAAARARTAAHRRLPDGPIRYLPGGISFSPPSPARAAAGHRGHPVGAVNGYANSTEAYRTTNGDPT